MSQINILAQNNHHPYFLFTQWEAKFYFKTWKTSWQMSSTTWDWFQNPEDSHGKTPLWHALFFGQSKFLSHIRGNVAGRTWANVQRNEHRILMSPVMRAESWLILSIGTKSWEVSPLNHTNHTQLCTFESCEYTCKERKAGIVQWMTKRGIRRTGWGMVFYLDSGSLGKSGRILLVYARAELVTSCEDKICCFWATSWLPTYSPLLLAVFLPCLFLPVSVWDANLEGGNSFFNSSS